MMARLLETNGGLIMSPWRVTLSPSKCERAHGHLPDLVSFMGASCLHSRDSPSRHINVEWIVRRQVNSQRGLPDLAVDERTLFQCSRSLDQVNQTG